MNYEDTYEDTEAYRSAIEEVKKFAKVKRVGGASVYVYPLSHFDYLCNVYLEGQDRSEVANLIVERHGCERGYALRLLSDTTGVDTSRQNEVREIFYRMCEALGHKKIFKHHVSPKTKASREKRNREGFGLEDVNAPEHKRRVH